MSSQDVNFGSFGNFRSDRPWELPPRVDRALPTAFARHDGDEGGRDGHPVGLAAGHVSYATKILSRVSVSDERGVPPEMAIDPALQQSSIPA